MDLRKGGMQPGSVVVVANAFSVAALIAHEIWRVGQDKVDTVGREAAKNGNTVAMKDGVARRDSEFGHVMPLFFELPP